MKSFHILLAAAAMFGVAAGAAQAREAVRVTGNGENFAVEYDPSYTGNIVGGGDTIARPLTGDATQADYVRPHTSKAQGIPTFAGGRHGDIVYTPAGR